MIWYRRRLGTGLQQTVKNTFKIWQNKYTELFYLIARILEQYMEERKLQEVRWSKCLSGLLCPLSLATIQYDATTISKNSWNRVPKEKNI